MLPKKGGINTVSPIERASKQKEFNANMLSYKLNAQF